MTANIIKKRGTYQIYLMYVDAQGMRRQKWFDTGLAHEGMANKKKAEQMKQDLYTQWLPLFEPNDPINDLMKKPNQRIQWSEIGKADEPSPKEELLFADILLQWLEWVRFRVQITTFQVYERIVVGIIEPYFRLKGFKPEDISVNILEEYHHFLRQQGRGMTTIRRHNSHIACAINYAIKKDLMHHNPAYLTTIPKHAPQAIRYYDIDDLEKLFRAVQNDALKIPVVLASYYGLRRGEIVGLEWDCIDFNVKTITVRQCAYIHHELGKHREQRIKYELKSINSYRTLPLYPEVEHILQQVLNDR